MDFAKGIDKRLALLATAVGQAGDLSVLKAQCLKAAMVIAAFYATPALASELPDSPTQRIRVHGDIVQHCEISAPHDADFGNLEGASKVTDLKFGLNCNVPFVMQVQAQYGALTNFEYPKGQGPYAGSLPYSLTFAIPARMPGATIIRRSFNSQELVGGQSISSQGGIATQGMDVHVALGKSNSEAGLIAGEYGETITLTVSVI